MGNWWKQEWLKQKSFWGILLIFLAGLADHYTAAGWLVTVGDLVGWPLASWGVIDKVNKLLAKK